MIGKTLLHYEILEQLGKGGMGVVYKARDNRLKRTVAIKALRPEALKDDESRKRFKREAIAASRLNHPNITTIYQIEEIDDALYIVMEYVPGETLGERLDDGPIEMTTALDITIKAAQGIAEAHRQKIIHRDIKPDNILLSSKGKVKVMDFGLAKRWDKSSVTPEGFSMGTVDYMSPEQAQSAKTDVRSDIFSFGILLYELFTGELPFKGDHDLAVLYAIVNSNPIPPKKINPKIPNRLEKTILRALEKKPEDRYQSITEIIRELKEIKKACKHELKPTLRKRRALAIALMGVCFAMCAILYWYLSLDSAKEHIDLAVSYIQQKRWGAAEAELHAALKIDSSSSKAWYYLANISYAQRDLKSAIERIEKAIDLDEKYKDAYYTLGYMLTDSNMIEQAKLAYHKAIEYDSSFVIAYSSLSDLYFRIGQPDSAIQLLNISLRITPDSQDNVHIYRNLGKVYDFKGQYQLAVENFEKALNIRPKDTELRRLFNSVINKSRLNQNFTESLDTLKTTPDNISSP